MSFDNELQDLMLQWGADLVGVAKIDDVSVEMKNTWDEDLQGFTRAIVAAVHFPFTVIEQLKKGPSHTYLHYYRVVNARLDDIALRVNTYLYRKGYNAFPVPTSQRTSKDKLSGIFPHRFAAELAGIGWVGKSGLLITPEFGPRVRLVTILTDAPLQVSQRIEGKCGACQLCMKACPAEAFKSENDFTINEETASKCNVYQDKVRSAFGKRVCGHCIVACPWGRKKNEDHK